MAIGDYAFLSKTFLFKDMFLKIFLPKMFLEKQFSKTFICSGNLCSDTMCNTPRPLWSLTKGMPWHRWSILVNIEQKNYNKTDINST